MMGYVTRASIDDEDDEFTGMRPSEVVQEHVSICEIAESYTEEGYLHIENGLTYEFEIHHIGLVGILGVITATAAPGNVKKSEIMEQMRIAAPKLSRQFRSELVDLLTGNNPHRHLLKQTYTDDYQLMSDTRQLPRTS